ncbi:MAG: 50S ribosomal protein L31 [candidate division NC10 bacterium]|nr:50S ribosomal protein L31 [candidate division NC10 bacterium]
MKKGIHPEYVPAMVTCACGEVFYTRAVMPRIRVEICSKCHPFFTGRERIIDTEGRVERFQRKYRQKGKVVQVSEAPEAMPPEA